MSRQEKLPENEAKKQLSKSGSSLGNGDEENNPLKEILIHKL